MKDRASALYYSGLIFDVAKKFLHKVLTSKKKSGTSKR